MDGNDGDLRLGITFNLLAQPADGSGGLRIDGAGEIVDVTCGLELFDGLRVQGRPQAGYRRNPRSELPDSVESHPSRL
jgi:hypothetical protein